MSNPKDICPLCNINEKGVRSKMCSECHKKKLSERASKQVKPESEPKLKTIKVGDTTPDGRYYL